MCFLYLSREDKGYINTFSPCHVNNLCSQKYPKLIQTHDQMKNTVSPQRPHILKFPFPKRKPKYLRSKKVEKQESQNLTPEWHQDVAGCTPGSGNCKVLLESLFKM